jgi:aryl-alcohol dehydrogenase-like predicted oxidoreductase
MLTGKFTSSSEFAADDHRRFNRTGAAFDKGETFSGVDYEVGLVFVERLRPLLPDGWTLTDLALAWILMNDAVTCAIPGAKRPDQVEQNVRAADLPPLPLASVAGIAALYDEMIRPLVHQLW